MLRYKCILWQTKKDVSRWRFFRSPVLSMWAILVISRVVWRLKQMLNNRYRLLWRQVQWICRRCLSLQIMLCRFFEQLCVVSTWTIRKSQSWCAVSIVKLRDVEGVMFLLPRLWWTCINQITAMALSTMLLPYKKGVDWWVWRRRILWELKFRVVL